MVWWSTLRRVEGVCEGEKTMGSSEKGNEGEEEVCMMWYR